jgi:hypothetical protein
MVSDGVSQLDEIGGGRRLRPGEHGSSVGTVDIHAFQEHHVEPMFRLSALPSCWSNVSAPLWIFLRQDPACWCVTPTLGRSGHSADGPALSKNISWRPQNPSLI